MKIFLSTAFALILSLQVHAADSAKLNFGSWHAGYDVELTDDGRIVGHVWGLGGTSGTVELERANGHWEGRLGHIRVKVTDVYVKFTPSHDLVTRIKLYTLPGAHHSYTARSDANGFYVNGYAGTSLSVYSTLKPDSFSGGHEFIHIGLNSAEDDNYSGWANVPGTFNNSTCTLDSEGALTPRALSTDPETYVLLYVLPYSLVK